MRPNRWMAFVAGFTLQLFVSLSGSGAQIDDSAAQARERAEDLVRTIRAKQWDRCVAFVATESDTKTLRRMGVPEGAGPEEVRLKIADWFRRLYDRVPPEEVVTVKIDARNQQRADVEYWHGDLDGFTMHVVDGAWYYSID